MHTCVAMRLGDRWRPASAAKGYRPHPQALFGGRYAFGSFESHTNGQTRRCLTEVEPKTGGLFDLDRPVVRAVSVQEERLVYH